MQKLPGLLILSFLSSVMLTALITPAFWRSSNTYADTVTAPPRRREPANEKARRRPIDPVFIGFIHPFFL